MAFADSNSRKWGLRDLALRFSGAKSRYLVAGLGRFIWLLLTRREHLPPLRTRVARCVLQ